jgi:hypothetical protein
LPGSDIAAALKVLPDGLTKPLIHEFEQALTAYRAGDWEKVGLKAGKFCEITYCICAGHVSGAYASAPSKPSNFPQSCLALEQHNKTKGRSLCIQVPRIITGLYELRNNRAIGHIGGDVDPNHMDAEIFLRGMKWVMAELVRFYSQLPLDESHRVVESVTAKSFSIVWTKGDTRRILEPARTTKEKVLILLYSENKPINIVQLQKWIEYKNGTEFRNKILKSLHDQAQINFNRIAKTAEILPPGQNFVENSGLLVVGKT